MGKPSSPSGTRLPVRNPYVTIYFVRFLVGFVGCVSAAECADLCALLVNGINYMYMVNTEHEGTTSKVKPTLLKIKGGRNLIERYHILVLVQRHQKARQ